LFHKTPATPGSEVGKSFNDIKAGLVGWVGNTAGGVDKVTFPPP